ncbi:MAG TPA: helix-turn-helix domain-containing protein [Pseudonocardia sp.]|jgi:excisionase family DNA binding protein|nr:helix-turn-helix domain-containing protein [Pseudonocardia sp.]
MERTPTLRAPDDIPSGLVELVTVNEAAALLRVSQMTVYRLIHANALPAIRVGRRSFRISRTDLAAYLQT